jgi:hypothetical protein
MWQAVSESPAEVRPPGCGAPVTALSTERYDELAVLVTNPDYGTDVIPELSSILASMLSSTLVGALRCDDSTAAGRAAILLGVLCETALPDDRDKVREIVRANLPAVLRSLASAQLTPAGRLGLLYLLAHFPEDRQLITSNLCPPDFDPDDLARLGRCLRTADFADPVIRTNLSRSWPTPRAWRLTAPERELDRQWRESLELTAEVFQRYWDSETNAVLAFLGARAEHAERQSRAY